MELRKKRNGPDLALLWKVFGGVLFGLRYLKPRSVSDDIFHH